MKIIFNLYLLICPQNTQGFQIGVQIYTIILLIYNYVAIFSKKTFSARAKPPPTTPHNNPLLFPQAAIIVPSTHQRPSVAEYGSYLYKI